MQSSSSPSRSLGVRANYLVEISQRGKELPVGACWNHVGKDHMFMTQYYCEIINKPRWKTGMWPIKIRKTGMCRTILIAGKEFKLVMSDLIVLLYPFTTRTNLNSSDFLMSPYVGVWKKHGQQSTVALSIPAISCQNEPVTLAANTQGDYKWKLGQIHPIIVCWWLQAG